MGFAVVPAKAAALEDRGQGVDEDESARHRQACGAAALAEAADQVVFGQAGQALADQPVHQAQAGGEFHTLLCPAILTNERGAAALKISPPPPLPPPLSQNFRPR